jgi:hypothetical protein
MESLKIGIDVYGEFVAMFKEAARALLEDLADSQNIDFVQQAVERHENCLQYIEELKVRNKGFVLYYKSKKQDLCDLESYCSEEEYKTELSRFNKFIAYHLLDDLKSLYGHLEGIVGVEKSEELVRGRLGEYADLILK